MDEENRREDKIESDGTLDVSDNTFVSRLSNFWYYHKWKVVIALFIIVLLSVTISQCVSNTKADTTVMYAGSRNMGKSDFNAVRAAFAEYLPEDFNGDGSYEVDIAAHNIFSKEQIEDRADRSKTDTNVIPVNNYVNTSELRSFDNLVMTGEYSIMIVEPWLYERVASSGGLRKLSDVLGETPEKRVDEYAYPLYETRIYLENKELFADFSPDTVICFRSKGILTDRSGTKYAEQEKFFVSIILGQKRGE